MSKFFKSCLGISIVLLVLIVGVIQCNKYNNGIIEEAFYEDHPNIKGNDFANLSSEDKRAYLNQIIHGEFEPFLNYGSIIEVYLTQGFKQVVKFPQTLEFKSILGWVSDYANFANNSRIEDVEKGILIASGLYRAENKLGQKIQGNYSIKYKFDGKKVEILDIQTY